LWIHAEALFARDSFRLLNTLELGMGTLEYAAFVKKLASQHLGKKKNRRTNRRAS
jgi:hypothetical protein